MKLDRTLWLTADRNEVVEDGDARAAFLLGTAGKEIPDAEAERLGLTSKPAAKKADAPEDKQADAPANKARTAAKKTAKRTTKKKG